MFRKTTLAVSVLLAVSAQPALATNGMLMEGYGPISTGMGGAASALDVGTSGMANNPATLTMMEDGDQKVEVALGNLRPDVSVQVPTPGGVVSSTSGGDSYLMPAAGYVRKQGKVSYGVGVLSQGGMGTEFAADTPLGAAAGGGARSELGIGAVIFPVAYEVNDNLSVGGTVDYVWGGLDMKMGMPIAAAGANPAAPGTFADFSQGQQVLGSASGTLVQGLGTMVAPAAMTSTAAAFDFSNDDDFSGKTTGAGVSGSLGATYKVNPKLTVGGSYRMKTAMDDFTGDGNMKLVNLATGATDVSIPGKYTIKDFQFPATTTVGAAYKLTDKTTVAADVSRIGWSDTMKDFNLNFTADNGAAADISMKQNWDDQTVVKLGVAHDVDENLTVRGGVNLANNPVPDAYLNPLFPAIVENHVTGGLTYGVGKMSKVSASLAYAPEVEQTNTNTNVAASHSQTNVQVMYSFDF
ncbi:long-chain fatty acid transport protein [Thiothrix caldifontis]|uniref:Long-chain fatty acid transport protein n=1 Tax=Thiothrix caldifontis TaxID=525918 RepID=A0A1H4CJS6_9GAMM|nr:outer membrane protein transport protein [Thiothrix caldifontis]SEA60604.1 long-chain fatty acid transport protein [Thiothrix caldifontis]